MVEQTPGTRRGPGDGQDHAAVDGSGITLPDPLRKKSQPPIGGGRNGSPKRIRTAVSGMRVRRPGPLDYGAKFFWLGDQDSNLGEMIQSHLCYRYIIPQRAGLIIPVASFPRKSTAAASKILASCQT